MLKKIGVLLSGTAIVSALAMLPAADVQASKTQFLMPVNDWQVGVVQETSAGQGSYCAMANQFEDGVVLAIAKDKDGAASLALDFKKSFLRPNSQHPIMIEIDQNISRKLQAVATNSRALVVQLGQDDAFLKALNKNGQLDVSFAKMRYSFALESFDQSFSRLTNCSDDLKSAAVQPASGDQMPPPMIIPEDDGMVVVKSKEEIQNKIDKAKEELTELRQEKEELMATAPSASPAPVIVDVATPHIPKKDPERDGYMRELKQIKVENVALSQKVASQKTRIYDLQDRIDAQEFEKQELTTRIQSLQNKMVMANAKTTDELAAQQQVSADYAALEATMAEKVKNLQELRQENLVLQELLSQKDAEIAKSAQAAETSEAPIEINSLTEMQAEKQSLMSQLEDLKAREAKTQQVLLEKEDEITQLKLQQLELKNAAAAVPADNQISETEYSNLRKERDELAARLAQLNEMTDKDKSEMAVVSQASDQTQKQLQALRQENLILNQQVSDLMAEKERLALASGSDQNALLTEKIAKIEAQENALTKLRDELEVMKTAYAALERENGALEVALATAKQTGSVDAVATIGASDAALNTLLKEQKAQLADLREENLRLLQNLTQSEERIRILERKTADYVEMDEMPANVSAELSMRKADEELAQQKADLMRMQADHQAQVEALEIERSKWVKQQHSENIKPGNSALVDELAAQRHAHQQLMAEKEAADLRIASLEADIVKLKEGNAQAERAAYSMAELSEATAAAPIINTTPAVPAEETVHMVPMTNQLEARALATPPAALRPTMVTNEGIQIDLGALSQLDTPAQVKSKSDYAYDLGKNGYVRPEIEVNDQAFGVMDRVQPQPRITTIERDGQVIKREELPFIALRNPKSGQFNAPTKQEMAPVAMTQQAQEPVALSKEQSIVIRKVLHEARIPVRQFNTDSYRTAYGQVVQYEKWNNDVLNGIHETMSWSENAGFEAKSKAYIDRYKEDCVEPLQFRNESYGQNAGKHMAVVTLYCPAPDTPYLTTSILYGEEGRSFEVVAMTANLEQEQSLYQYRDQYLETFTRLHPDYQF